MASLLDDIAKYGLSQIIKNFEKGVYKRPSKLPKKPTGEPVNTITGYKLFRTDKEGNLYPLFVNAKQRVPLGKWLDAEAGMMTPEGKVKSSLGPLSYRAGWHAGDHPVATHIGGKSSKNVKKPDYRPDSQVWAEVLMPNDVDWQSEALSRALRKKSGGLNLKTAEIKDQIPYGGTYRYKTNPNMTGDWLIGGSMKVNRVLPRKEVDAINKRTGVYDLPTYENLQKILQYLESTKR